MKFIIFFALFLITLLRGAFSDIQLTSSGPGTLRPGENLNLVCKVTGVSITDSSYAWNWIRQPPGKGLEWVARIYLNDGSKYYASSLRSRLTISADSSTNQVFLQLNSVTAADSDVYYCARSAGTYYWGLEYWGAGTLVTVTSASQTAPHLFPLIPSLCDPISGNDVTIGCLAKDFLPDSLTLSWQKPDNGSLEAGKIRRFPSVNSNGFYTTSSEATVPADQWKALKPFYCKAELASETRVTRVVRQNSLVCPPSTIIVRVPPLEDFQGPYLNATLLCKADNLDTESTTIKWLENGNVLTSGFTTSAPIRQGNCYSIISELIVTKRDWYTEKTYSCQVQNKKFDEIRNVSMLSICTDCGSPEVPVRVETIPPSFADIYLTKSAKLTCRISNIPFGQDLEELNVTWIRERDNKLLETVIGQPKEQENKGMVFVDATATICTEEWTSGDNYLCKVRLPLLASAETRSLKKESGAGHNPPAVYVLPPPSEQLALRETATLTCLLRDFTPPNTFVKWMRNDVPVDVSEYYTSNPVQESTSPKRYFAYSTVNVNEQEWNSGTTYTCIVGHEALPYQTIQKTIDKNTGKPTLVNVSLVLSDATNTCY